MEFEKVTKEHILEAIKDFEERGIPKGFGPSSTYDLVFNGKEYPPKAVMAYANFRAIGKEITPYFKGGTGTDAFKAFENNGFKIVPKNKSLLEEYLQEFSDESDEWFRKNDWFVPQYNFFQSFLTHENIVKAEWEDFQEMGNHIHSFNSMAIAKGNALGKMNLPIEEYREIFEYIISRKDPVNTTVNNLYKKYEGKYALPFFSDSSISELIANAYPEDYVLYNTRDVDALEILGMKLPKVRGEKFGDRFLRYNKHIAPIVEHYTKIVGNKTEAPINLEVDQFFSWLYINKKQQKPIKDLLVRYKESLRTKGLSDEKYKWEFVRNFKGKPTLKADIFEEIKSIKFENLLYHLSLACLKDIAKEYGPELIKEFTALYDETVDVSDRIKSYKKQTLKLYKKLNDSKNSHQDERTAAVFLALKNPEEYTFYKSSYYKAYCDYLSIKTGKPNYKYEHYLELLNELVSEFISKDEELLGLVKSQLGDLVEEDPNYLLLAQDILFRMFDQEPEETNYWIFQGNPKIYDFETGLREDVIKDWNVSAHKDKIKFGDKVILWITGSSAGCYALAEITEEPSLDKKSPDNDLWKVDNKNELKAGIKIIHNLVDAPILKEQINDFKELSSLNVGKQGTNFSATKEEYNKLLEMASLNNKGKQYWLYAPGESAAHWDEFYSNGVLGLGWDELGDLKQYATKEDIVNALQAQPDSKGSRKNDASANWEFANEIKIGDVVIAKKGRSEFLGYGVVTGDVYYNPSEEYYHNRRKIDWKIKGNWKRTDGKTLVLKTLTNITPYPEYVKMIKELMGIDNATTSEKTKLNIPQNMILYGPPGTGKTYKLTNEYFDLFTERKQVVSLEDKQKKLAEKHSWWEVITIALLDLKKAKVKDILNHPIVNARKSISEVKNLRALIWGSLQTFTDKNCENVNTERRREPGIFWKDDESNWTVDVELVKESLPEIYEDFEWMNYAEEEENLKQRFKTVTFHQSYSYEDFIEGIKPVLETGDADNSEIGYQIEAGIFKKICLDAKNDPNQPYAIFIDEINRGNVASVFGELITLIEPDKRIGEKNEISIELPYSKKNFSVPPNLHIIGTMNTADRSVEALDTALRRRFSFVEMIPEPKKIESDGASKGKIDDIDLVKLLSTINERIEILVDRDHTIGHAFFMNTNSLKALKAVIADKIIPLLQEYFYGDYHKMELVLGNGFFKKKSVEKVAFAVETDLQFEGEMFTILDAKKMSDKDFKDAITGIGFNAE